MGTIRIDFEGQQDEPPLFSGALARGPLMLCGALSRTLRGHFSRGSGQRAWAKLNTIARSELFPDWTPRKSRYWPVSEPIIKNSRCPDQKLFMARSSCVFARFKPLLLKAILSSAPVSLFSLAVGTFS